MGKTSAGIVAYRHNEKDNWQMLLVHPGGPFFKNKDLGVWSIPKGEYGPDENAFEVALREFEEETGNCIKATEAHALAPVKTKGGKVICSWAIEANFEQCFIKSNGFSMEWPPKSGKQQLFPEVDDARWFNYEEALLKINASQASIIEELAELLKHK